MASEQPSDTAANSRSWTVEPGEAGLRLDRFLATRVAAVSRAQVQAWIRGGAVSVQGAVVTKPAHAVAAGDAVELAAELPTRVQRSGDAEGARELVVLHEDEELVVVDKPAGMVCHPSQTVRGGTLSERAEERWGALPSPQGEDRPGIVHRLDRQTSGLIVLARTPRAAAELMRQFREREVNKRYLALVGGEPRFDSDWIEARLRRTQGRGDRMEVVRERVEEEDEDDHEHGLVALGGGGDLEPQGREAQTFYKTLERLRGFALLECHPRTGRTHQIRVHLESIGHPVLGDELYRGRGGSRYALPGEAPALKRHALHASRLRFVHPGSGEELEFEAGLPADMEGVLGWLRGRVAGG